MGFKITSLTAIVGADPSTGDEGIWGMKSPDGWVPMVCADAERLKSLLPEAIAMAKALNRTFRVLRFDNMSDITDQIEGKTK